MLKVLPGFLKKCRQESQCLVSITVLCVDPCDPEPSFKCCWVLLFVFCSSGRDMSSGLVPSLTELISNLHLFIVSTAVRNHFPGFSILLQFVLLLFSLTTVVLTFPLMDKAWPVAAALPRLFTSSRLQLLFFCSLYLFILFFPPPTKKKNSSAHEYNVFIFFFFSPFDFCCPSHHFLNVLCCVSVVFLFFFSSFLFCPGPPLPYAALFCWCMEHIWCLDSCG